MPVAHGLQRPAPDMRYVRLPPARRSLPHEKLIAMVIAAALGSFGIAAARTYHRPAAMALRAMKTAP